MNKKTETIKENEILFWDYKYNNYENIYNPNRDSYFHNHFKEPIKKLNKGAKVLEIACGVRVDGLELAKLGYKMTELDISSQAVDKTKKLFESQNLSGSFVIGDIENLSFKEGEFDAVFTAASFHHFPNPLQALIEMKRVTKPGGRIILGVEPNAWPYYTLYLILKPLKFLIRKINPRPYNSLADDQCWGFTKYKLKKLFKQADIKIIEIKRVKYLQEIYEQWLRLISRLFHKNKENKNILNKLGKIDQEIAKIPILNLFNWYWNVIGKK